MPYKFVYTHTKLPKGKDRRCKLTDEDKEDIKELHFVKGWGVRKIARAYPQVSRRLIQFVLFPERLKVVADNAKTKKAWLLYYDREKHTKAMREHRQYKQSILGGVKK